MNTSPIDMKFCKICEKDLSVDCFEFAYSEKKRHVNPTLRRKSCKKCRSELNKKRIEKDPDFYKKRYRSMSEEQRKSHIKRVSESQKNDPNIFEKRRRYNKSDAGIFNRYKADCLRRGRKDRGICFDLTFEQFVKLINNSCSYCGQENCRGIDRIDPSRSYTLDNSSPCCAACNEAKSDRSLEEFKKHITKIYNKLIER